MTQRPPERCRCCGYRTGCLTCPICFWTEDGRPESAADLGSSGPNGDLSLSEARLNFAIYGASHRRYRDLVRPPREDERPAPDDPRLPRQRSSPQQATPQYPAPGPTAGW